MKKLLILIAFVFSVKAYAQPSIGSSNMPQNGDTLRYTIAFPDSAVLTSFNNTGTNQNWQFGNLVPDRQGLAEYFASNQTPYNVSNRTAELLTDTLSLGAISLFDVYNFYNNSSSEYALDRRGFSIPNPIPLPPPFNVIRQAPTFTDKDEVYQFPLSYLDRDSSTFDFNYSNTLAGIFVSSSGYRINEVEAWGSITTPYGTFTCIKVKTDIVSYDTVSFGTTNFGLNSHQREYKWLSPQLRYPVANLSGTVVAGVFIPGTIQYRDSARSGLNSIFAPFALFDADTTIINLGDTLPFNNFTLSITPATFQWSISPATHTYVNGTSSTSDEPEVQFNAVGFYDVQLVATNTFGTDTLFLSSYIEVKQPTSLAENKIASSIKIFPNPALSGQEIRIEAESSIGQIWLYDQKSRLVGSWQAQDQKSIQLNLNTLDFGLYYLQMELDGDRITKKLIVN